MPGRVVVQWDKEDCADLGLIKVDLLGLGMMAVLEDSIELIRDSYKEEVDLAHLPQDDDAVYRFTKGRHDRNVSGGEPRADVLPAAPAATKFYDIVVQVAIIRPGPIVGKMVHPYLKRRQRPRAGHGTSRSFAKPVLKRTLGVPLPGATTKDGDDSVQHLPVARLRICDALLVSNDPKRA